MPATEHDHKTADGALLGLTFLESIAENDRDKRQMIFEAYPTPALAWQDLTFATAAAFNFLLERCSAQADVSKVEYIKHLRADYIEYAEMLRSGL